MRSRQTIRSKQGQRVAPMLPASAVKTYALLQPLRTHTRAATCAEIECEGWKTGWRSVFDESTELGKTQAAYVRARCGRSFRESREAGLTVFTFPAGQRCFRATEHRVSLERPVLYVVREGDWRGNPRRTPRREFTPDGWVNHFGEHQDTLARKAR